MKIITLTVNPALDKSSKVDKLVPESKLRCTTPKYEPGGGGVNVSRAIKKLGGDSLAIYLAGGPSGDLMKTLLDGEGVKQHVIPTKSWTRENFIVVDGYNQQFRFGMPGNSVEESEWKNSLILLENLEEAPEYIVASGSLSPGIPEDYYAQVAKIAKKIGAKLILDTSGKALELALNEGVFLIKPNLGELSKIVNEESITEDIQEELALKIVKSGKSEIVVVSLGPRGAMLVNKEVIEYVVPPTVHKQSTVGAGDSMVGGIILSLSQGKSVHEALMYGVASGTAATMNNGTELCKKEDVEELYKHLEQKERKQKKLV